LSRGILNSARPCVLLVSGSDHAQSEAGLLSAIVGRLEHAFVLAKFEEPPIKAGRKGPSAPTEWKNAKPWQDRRMLSRRALA